jgi:[histone H4]-N-methyl-L-lysine20 N-methyltransferase
MRHFAIYGMPWPQRIPPKNAGLGSSFIPTPREESTPVDNVLACKVTHKTLSSLDRKLVEAAAIKKRKRAQSEERSSKKQRTEDGPRVKVSARAKEALQAGANSHSRSGRKKVPTLKALASGEPPRKRGRPRKIRVEPEEAADGEGVPPERQPRETNGRFGKKQRTNGVHARRHGVRSSARVERRTGIQRAIKTEDEGDTINGSERLERRRNRNSSSAETDGEDEEAAAARIPTLEVEKPISSTLSFRSGPKIVGGLLYRTPNPISFASRRWTPLVAGADLAELLDQDLRSSEAIGKDTAESPAMTDSASEDELPVTPEDVNGDDASVALAEDGDGEELPPVAGGDDSAMAYSMVSPVAVSRLGSLTWKPSPVNFAMHMRKWSLSMRKGSPVRDEEKSVGVFEDGGDYPTDHSVPRDVSNLPS